MKEKRLAFIFLVPIVLVFLFELITSKIYLERFYNFFENIFFAVLLVFPIFIFKNKAVKKYYLILVYIFMLIVLFFETGYYSIFNTKFSRSSIFIASQSNLAETKEFFLFYFDSKILILLIGLIVLLSFSVTKINKSLFNSIIIYRPIVWVAKFLILSVLFITIFRTQNLPFLIVDSYYDLNKDIYYDNLEAYSSAKGPFKRVIEELNDSINKTFVIIIGESTNKRHLNLYGYERKTNPLLSQIRDELLIYRDVISSHSYTTEALKGALTIDENQVKGTIFQLMNSAGYSTFWLSNQNPIGFHESLVSRISKACTKQIFITAATSDVNKIYDEALFVELDSILANNEKRKVIFLHLQGTHLDYFNRYPNSYDIFKDTPPSSKKYLDVNNYDVVNSYDNAVLYNDFVVRTIIDKVKAKKTYSYVLYFSDHGEELYDTMSFSGHNKDLGTLPMFQVPFILWQSDAFRKQNEIQANLDRSYMTDDLFHSIADLSGVKNSSVDRSRSIFSDNFESRNRKILNNQNYDSLLIKMNYKR